MEILRTPDERFASLPGYPFAPHYTQIDGLRVHYVDEGKPGAPVVLLLHGEPSWSYLYRKMVPILVEAGLRAVAPDLVGFGRSDKPARREDYSYQRHVDWLRGFVEALSLRRRHAGVSGLGRAARAAAGGRAPGVVRARGGVEYVPADRRIGPPSAAFLGWRKYSQETPRFHAGGIVRGGCATPLAPEVVAAYDAPFPDDRYLSGARQFPMLVPISPDDPAAAANCAAWSELERFEKPFLTAFSDLDPITRGMEAELQKRIPGAHGQPHTTIQGGGHFLQEDCGEELARTLVAFVKRTAG